MVKKEKERHEFAFYVPTLFSLIKTIVDDTIIFSDEKLIHRMKFVLRLLPEEECIFFDKQMHIYCIIKEYKNKKSVLCTIKTQKLNNQLLPRITFLLPMLKKEDIETALYSLAEIGVTTIQLISTQKTHRFSFTQKDMERLQRIIIAAAEQSKNFAYPDLKAPINMIEALVLYDAIPQKIFFDIQGKSCAFVMQNLCINSPSDIILLIGPEGDLTTEEKDLVAAKNFIACKLTPTILRSVQTVSIGAGFVRSLLVSVLLFVLK